MVVLCAFCKRLDKRHLPLSFAKIPYAPNYKSFVLTSAIRVEHFSIYTIIKDNQFRLWKTNQCPTELIQFPRYDELLEQLAHILKHPDGNIWVKS